MCVCSCVCRRMYTSVCVGGCDCECVARVCVYGDACIQKFVYVVAIFSAFLACMCVRRRMYTGVCVCVSGCECGARVCVCMQTYVYAGSTLL